MKIYIDEKYKCHTTNTNGVYREVETDFFDKKCVSFIEGYRFVPEGESWIRTDGTMFTGEMVAPWKNYKELDEYQRQYEQQLLIEYENEKTELITSYIDGVNSI